jgi:transcriptional regulator with XRE-family HTH domain
MGTVNDRIKELRLALQISQRQFAKRIFASQSLLDELELSHRNVNDRIIHLISSQFKVNIEWLKTGEGEMFFDTPPDVRLEHIIEIFNKLDRTLQDYLLLQSNEKREHF